MKFVWKPAGEEQWGHVHCQRHYRKDQSGHQVHDSSHHGRERPDAPGYVHDTSVSCGEWRYEVLTICYSILATYLGR